MSLPTHFDSDDHVISHNRIESLQTFLSWDKSLHADRDRPVAVLMRPEVSLRTGDNALHLAIRQRPAFTLAAIVAAVEAAGGPVERAKLVNLKDRNGDTPLMLAVQEATYAKQLVPPETLTSVVRYLLANGAVESILTRSSKRRTAADRAEEHNMHHLALELRALEEQE
eukprot:scaffold647984_cov43-Prasinocladus_malaysianus.AAC.1